MKEVLLSIPIPISDASDLLRLEERLYSDEDVRYLVKAPSSSLLARSCLSGLLFLLLRVLCSCTRLSSESLSEYVTGTAPYDPVPSAGDDRISRGFFDIIVVHKVDQMEEECSSVGSGVGVAPCVTLEPEEDDPEVAECASRARA